MHPLVRCSVALCALAACSVWLAGAAAALPASTALQDDVHDSVEFDDPDATETPEQTIEFDGQLGTDGSFTVTSVSSFDPGEEIELTVELPASADVESFGVNLYDAERDLVDTNSFVVRDEDGPPSGTVRLEGDGPGTYGLTVWVDNELVDVYPAVVEGYDLEVDAPDEPVAADGTTTVSVTPSATADDPPEIADVEVAAWSDGTTVRASASEANDGTYEVELDASDLPAGDHQLYVAATSDEAVGDYQAALAVDGDHSIEVAEGDADDGSDDADDGSGDGGLGIGGGSSDDADDADDASGDDAGGEDATDDAADADDQGSDGDGDDGTDVIQPSDDADDPAAGSADDGSGDDAADGDSVPGFGFGVALAALLLTLARCRTRTE